MTATIDALTVEREQVIADTRREIREERDNKFAPWPEQGSEIAEIWNNLAVLSNDDSISEVVGGMLPTSDLIETTLPLLRRHVRTNPMLWDSRRLGKGYVVNSRGRWVRSPGLGLIYPIVKKDLQATVAVLRQVQARAEAVVTADPMPDYLEPMNSAVIGKMNRSVMAIRSSGRSFGGVMGVARAYLTEPPEWFEGLVAEWLLDYAVAGGEVPEIVNIGDLNSRYTRDGYPSGLSWEDHVKGLLNEYGLIVNHSGTEKVKIGNDEVRETLREIARGYAGE